MGSKPPEQGHMQFPISLGTGTPVLPSRLSKRPAHDDSKLPTAGIRGRNGTPAEAG